MPTLMPAPRMPDTVGRDAVRPAFGDQRDAVGPHAADAEADQKPQHQHLLAAL